MAPGTLPSDEAVAPVSHATGSRTAHPTGAGTDHATGTAFMLLAAVLWALLGIFGKLAQSVGVSAQEVGFWRAIIGCLCFAVHARLARAVAPRGRDLASTGLFGVFGVAGLYSVYQFAVQSGGASLASVLLYTAPAFVAIEGWLLLGERLAAAEAAAVGLALGGIALISAGGGTGIVVSAGSVSLGVASGVCYSLYYPFGRRFFPCYDPSVLFAIAMGVGAVCLAPFVRFERHPLSGWVSIAAIGIACTYAAYLCYGIGLRHLAATRASVIATLEPVVAASLAAVFFGERLGTVAVIGAGAVICAALMLAFRPGAAPAPQ